MRRRRQRRKTTTAPPQPRLPSRWAAPDFEGTICPGDDDYFRFTLTSPSTVQILLVIGDAEQDLDLWLYDAMGTQLDESRGILSEERIDASLAAGDYVVRVDGFRGDSTNYLGEVTATMATTCASSSECPITEVCSASGCVPRSCTSNEMCPTNHQCPTAGPAGAPRECGVTCQFNRDCRSGEACKWYPEGRFCARRGDEPNGDACASANDCGGQRACIPWPGGTCARAGCTSNSNCENGTHCVDSGLGYRGVRIIVRALGLHLPVRRGVRLPRFAGSRYDQPRGLRTRIS